VRPPTRVFPTLEFLTGNRQINRLGEASLFLVGSGWIWLDSSEFEAAELVTALFGKVTDFTDVSHRI
jgi:hypothetical protein